MVGTVRVQHLFLSPLVVLGVPPQSLAYQSLLVTGVLGAAGVLALPTRKPGLSKAVSLTLLAILLWGKVIGTILQLPTPETAYLLFQFVLLLFFIEARNTVEVFDARLRLLRGKVDETSRSSWNLLRRWFHSQLVTQAKFMMVAFALSLGLLVLGGLTSVAIDQILVAGLLALFSVLALLFLMSYRREPEET